MKLFVTGGAGFIGRHLVDSLLREGHSVTVFDISSKSSAESKLDTSVKVIKGDIKDYEVLSNSLKSHDGVIHLAARISVLESISDPELTNSVNVDGTVNLLHACAEKNIKRFVFASSAAVYGESRDLPISESSHINPLSPYGASKVAAEYYIKAFSNYFDMNSVILRVFNVYGKGQSDEYAGVITKFVDRILDNKNPIIYGDGSQTRDFVYVDDVVEAFSCAIKNIDGKCGQVYNIASGKFVSIKELADLMIDVSGKDLSTDYQDALKGDIKESQCTVFLARKDLGFEPRVGLKEGIKKILEFQRE